MEKMNLSQNSELMHLAIRFRFTMYSCTVLPIVTHLSRPQPLSLSSLLYAHTAANTQGNTGRKTLTPVLLCKERLRHRLATGQCTYRCARRSKYHRLVTEQCTRLAKVCAVQQTPYDQPLAHCPLL